MKKQVISLAVLFVLWAAASHVAAALPQADSGDNQANGGRPTPEQVVARLDSKLSLSDDQKAKITPIIADRQEKLKDLQAESGRRMKKAREAKSIFQDSDKKIEAVLTDDQKQKYEELEKQMREQMEERRQQRNNASSQ